MKLKKKLMSVFLCVAALTTLISCTNDKSKIIGSWKCTELLDGSRWTSCDGDGDIEIKSDGSYTSEGHRNGDWTLDDKRITFSAGYIERDCPNWIIEQVSDDYLELSNSDEGFAVRLKKK